MLSAVPASGPGISSAEAATNSVLGSPPRAVERAARRETSDIALASASMPTNKVLGSPAARLTIARPLPEPTSMTTRSWRAISSAT